MFSPRDFTQVGAALIRELGGNATLALVLARIHWRLEHLPAGSWWRGSAGQLAEETGLSVDQVNRQIKRLRERGYLETVKEQRDGPSDQTLSYRPVVGDTGQRDRGIDIADSRREGTADSRSLPVLPRQVSTKTVESAKADAFEEFWEVYPRHVGKQEARRKFTLAARTTDPAVIIAGARQYRDDPRRKPDYTKHPATWLHQGCWTDEPVTHSEPLGWGANQW
jgi:hypothetical protein